MANRQPKTERVTLKDDRTLCLRFTVEEVEYLHSYAEKRGVTMEQVVRQWVNATFRERMEDRVGYVSPKESCINVCVNDIEFGMSGMFATMDGKHRNTWVRDVVRDNLVAEREMDEEEAEDLVRYDPSAKSVPYERERTHNPMIDEEWTPTSQGQTLRPKPEDSLIDPRDAL